MSSRSFGGSKSGGDPRKQLETLIGAALHTKGGRVSASKVRLRLEAYSASVKSLRGCYA